MREDQFMKFLEQDSNITSKTKAVNSRMSRARRVEVEYSVNLDIIVRSVSTLEKVKCNERYIWESSKCG